MGKYTLLLESPADLSVRMGQVVVDRGEGYDILYRSLDDLQTIIVDNHSVHLTVPLINKLSENKVSVVFCDERHMPVTMQMDLDSNSTQTRFFRGQIEAGLPMKKQLWQQIVSSKIRNQSQLLSKLQKGDDPLKVYYRNVLSGDRSNREAVSAKMYWKLLMGKEFIRDRIGECPNNLLNYGNALLRSAVARALMNSGLLPTVGIFHRNYYNSFPLADDVMEPYRPYVDELVYSLFMAGQRDIDTKFKKAVLELFYDRLSSDTISSTTHSLANVYSGNGQIIWYPKFE